MKFVYIEGWYGNGFEDAGEEITLVKAFETNAEALKESGLRFMKFAVEYGGLSDEQIADKSVHEIAEFMNGWVDVAVGRWSVQPESTSFGLIKKLY
jgi:hypothetical protein